MNNIRTLTLLVVDDDPDDIDLLRFRLEAIPEWQVKLLACTHPVAARAALAEHRVDAVVIDYMLGEDTGLSLLRELRASGCVIPVIMATGQGNEEIAVDVMKAGADDYLVKAELSTESVRRAVTNAVDKHRLREALEARQHELLDAHDRLKRSHAEIQSFYHIVSHELKTPLTSAREFISIVLDGLAGPITDQQREYLAVAKDSCDHLTRGINDLVDCARLDTGKLAVAPARTAVERLLEKAVKPLQAAVDSSGIRFSLQAAPGLPAVYVDEHRMAQVITNLLSNALKFTHKGGHITLTAEVLAADRPVVQVSVSDTGRGIDAAHLPNIFNRLYQANSSDTAAGGLGLGLYICRELVRLHGGEIAAESTLGAGSTFRFTMPVHAVHADNLGNRQEQAA